MTDRTRIEFVREWSRNHPVGHVEDLPSHIAKRLCEGDEPFAREVTLEGEYVHRAITSARPTVRSKRARKTKKKDAAE